MRRRVIAWISCAWLPPMIALGQDLEQLEKRLEDPSIEARRDAAVLIAKAGYRGQTGPDQAAAILGRGLKSSDAGVRGFAAWGLGMIAFRQPQVSGQVLPLLEGAAADDADTVRIAAYEALGLLALRTPEHSDKVAGILRDELDQFMTLRGSAAMGLLLTASAADALHVVWTIQPDMYLQYGRIMLLLNNVTQPRLFKSFVEAFAPLETGPLRKKIEQACKVVGTKLTIEAEPYGPPKAASIRRSVPLFLDEFFHNSNLGVAFEGGEIKILPYKAAVAHWRAYLDRERSKGRISKAARISGPEEGKALLASLAALAAEGKVDEGRALLSVKDSTNGLDLQTLRSEWVRSEGKAWTLETRDRLHCGIGAQRFDFVRISQTVWQLSNTFGK